MIKGLESEENNTESIESDAIQIPSVFVETIEGDQPDLELEALRTSPYTANTSDAGMFDFVGVFTESSAPNFSSLPRRTRQRPYLVWSHRFFCPASSPCPMAEKVIKDRDDFVFVNYDLRDPWLADDSHTELPGVTMAPPGYFEGSTPSAAKLKSWTYFLTFKGKMHPGWYDSATVRPDLQEMWSNNDMEDVVVEIVPHEYKYTEFDNNRYNELMDTAYAIVPHGEGRWNYRFSEVMGAYAIPVVIADGISLPSSELIEWKDISIQIPERVVKTPGAGLLQMERASIMANPKELLDRLPRDPEFILKTRQRVCEINEKYFKTAEKRWAALLQSAAIYVQSH
jgi:hypothetical protein